ncbi:heparan-alpha-glucosaminide N-acetyltransferase domain-containing protein [Leptothoe sp. ISB3NOV94-8A]
MTPQGKVNKRSYYLDIARGFAVFGMFTQHCMIVHEVSGGEGDSLLANLFVLLGTAPAAPVFMLLMGAFLIKSKASTRQNMWRGIKLLILGIILNLLRFTIPVLIAISLYGRDNLNLAEGETLLTLLFAVDIFHLAGLSLIFCTLIKKITDQKNTIPLLILTVLLASPFLWGRFGSNPFFDPFWGEANTVYFPFFPWIIYPLLGMYLSRYLLSGDRLKSSLRKMGWYGFGLSALGIVIFLFSAVGILAFDVLSPIGDYYRSGASIHLLMIGFVLAWFSVCHWLEQTLSIENRIIKVLIYWSKNVTAIYFVQWVLFGWSMLILDTNKLNAVDAALVGLIVLLLTHFSVKRAGVRKLFAWV